MKAWLHQSEGASWVELPADYLDKRIEENIQKGLSPEALWVRTKGAKGRPGAPVTHEMKQKFTIVFEQDEDGWWAISVPEVPGCRTQAKTIEQGLRRIKEGLALFVTER